MNTSTRPPEPEVNYESFYLMLGTGYNIHKVYNEQEDHWFIEITRKIDRKD